jgi:hypothetical protein
MMEAFLHYSGYNYSIQRGICQEKTTVQLTPSSLLHTESYITVARTGPHGYCFGRARPQPFPPGPSGLEHVRPSPGWPRGGWLPLCRDATTRGCIKGAGPRVR